MTNKPCIALLFTILGLALSAASASAGICFSVDHDPAIPFTWQTQIGGTFRIEFTNRATCQLATRIEPRITGLPSWIEVVEEVNTDRVVRLRFTIKEGAYREGSFWLGWNGFQRPAGFDRYVWANGWSEYMRVVVRDGEIPPFTDLETTALFVHSRTDQWENLTIHATGRNVGDRPLWRSTRFEAKIDGQTNVGGTPVPAITCHEDLWNDSVCRIDGELHVTPGLHEVEVCADPRDRIGDRNRENNCDRMTIDVPPLRPDLQVWIDAGPPRYGEPWPIDLLVANRGNANSPPFELEIETPDGIETRSVGALGWGHSTRVSTSWTPDSGGSVTLRAHVDPDNQIPEHDNDNNQDSTTRNIIGAPPETVNLVFEEGAWSVDPPEPYVGQTVTFTARMRNIGSVATDRPPSFEIRVAGARTVTCPAPLGPGEECVGSRTFTPTSAGDWLIELLADPDGVIDEGEGELDNQRFVTINVEEPEALPNLFFLPSDVIPAGPIPDAGGDLGVNITVRNGGATIEFETVELQILEDGHWNGDSLFIPAPFPSGESRTVFHLWDGVTAGEHTLQVVADPANAIDEGPEGEDDNLRSLLFQIADGGPQLTCQGIWELTDIATGDTFHNLGSVRDGCHVNWGSNVPTGQCWRTNGLNGLSAHWFTGANGCPVEALISNGVSLQVRVLSD